MRLKRVVSDGVDSSMQKAETVAVNSDSGSSEGMARSDSSSNVGAVKSDSDSKRSDSESKTTHDVEVDKPQGSDSPPRMDSEDKNISKVSKSSEEEQEEEEEKDKKEQEILINVIQARYVLVFTF